MQTKMINGVYISFTLSQQQIIICIVSLYTFFTGHRCNRIELRAQNLPKALAFYVHFACKYKLLPSSNYKFNRKLHSKATLPKTIKLNHLQVIQSAKLL